MIALPGFKPETDVILVVPPFAGLDRPSLGLHVLAACCARRGQRAYVFYSNIHFASLIGEGLYQSICYAPTTHLLGERIFAPAAFGFTPAPIASNGKSRNFRKVTEWADVDDTNGKVDSVQRDASKWVGEIAVTLAAAGVKIIGCNAMFEQVSASVAILDALKGIRDEAITVMGGAHCEGPMAEGILSLGRRIDYVFSGECETAFPDFVARVLRNDSPTEPIVVGSPCLDLDQLPLCEFSDYYIQMQTFLPKSSLWANRKIWLPFETSRGCWWGQKHHCTFCGINGQGMAFRKRSPKLATAELRRLAKHHPTNLVCMVDNIMPVEYFDSLLPDLRQDPTKFHIFYEQKANLKPARVKLLKDAGVAVIQPGIEALSSDLLRHMKKGVNASQNIALLRYARAVDLHVNWNLLYAFPNDQDDWYANTLEIIKCIPHLCPPTGVCHLSIDRFSPYHVSPGQYGIASLRPMAAYYDVFPRSANIQALAYHFEGDYECSSRRSTGVISEIELAVEVWREAWTASNKLPILLVRQLSPESFLLIDRRSQDREVEFAFIDIEQATAALVELNQLQTAAVAWAFERKVALPVDGKSVPLAVADLELIAKLRQRISNVTQLREIELLNL